jgi:pimeloyl-ACP methyl ester carboxylesterase
MISCTKGMFILIIFSFIGGCVGARQPVTAWDARERSSLGGWTGKRGESPMFKEKFIPAPLHANDGYFDLYYYIVEPTSMTENVDRKTVLFVAGGPGQITRWPEETFINFLAGHGYQVVFFHLRGSGFSQLPPSNDFDRFLRTRYAVKDIEEIRRDLLQQKLLRADGKWDAVVGWSYGTILAQEYTSAYHDNVEKLVLIGPQSRHMFVHPRVSIEDEFKNLNKKVTEIQRDSLDRILQSLPDFQEPHPQTNQKEQLLDKVFGGPQGPGILQRSEQVFGSVQFIVENYCNLQNKLHANELSYSRRFFENLRALRRLGSVHGDQIGQETRTNVGKALINELREGPPKDNICAEQNDEQENYRNFFVMTAYDGISASFLKEWLSSDKRDFREALRQSVGTAGAISYVEKVGVANDAAAIAPWSPAKHVHSVPTLILKGGDDPVSAGYAAEAFYNQGLAGPRTLINFPGVGHEFTLPLASELNWYGIINFDAVNIPGNDILPVIGRMVGTKVDPRFELTLEPSEPTRNKDNLDLVGFGVRNDEHVVDEFKARENIVALFRNKGGHKFNGGSIDWILKGADFTATVRFVLKQSREQQQIGLGTIIGGKRLSPARIKVEAADALTGRSQALSVPCYQLTGSNKLAVWFFHRGDSSSLPIPPNEGREFTIFDGKNTKSIFVELDQPLQAGKVTQKDLRVDGLTLSTPDYSVELKDKGKFDTVSACIPREETIGGTLTMILRNTNDQADWNSEANRIWIVTTDRFEAHVRVETGLNIPPGEMVKVTGRVHGVRLNMPLTLRPPQGSQIDWLAINVLGPSEVSVLLQNKERTAAKTPEDWAFNVVPARPGPCNPTTLRDCLIYNFIAMDTTNFKRRGISNVIKSVIGNAFSATEKSLEHDLKILHCSGPEDSLERCEIPVE